MKLRFLILWNVRWTFVSWPNSSVGTQSCPNSPGRSAGRSDPTCPWYVRVWDSPGEKYDRALFPGRIVLLAPNLARPFSAAAPGFPTRPARGMSGFRTRQVCSCTGLCRWILSMQRHRCTSLHPSASSNKKRFSSCWQTIVTFPDMPCMRLFYKDKKAFVHWSAARTKERFSSRG